MAIKAIFAYSECMDATSL